MNYQKSGISDVVMPAQLNFEGPFNHLTGVADLKDKMEILLEQELTEEEQRYIRPSTIFRTYGVNMS